MNKIKMASLAVVALMAGVSGAMAAPVFTDLSTAITESAVAVTAVVTVAIVAGFGIYVLIWGARKIKGGLASGG